MKNDEVVVELKKIPETNWSICLTNRNHEFFYHEENQDLNTWEIPYELQTVLNDLLNEALPMADIPDWEEEEEVVENLDNGPLLQERFAEDFGRVDQTSTTLESADNLFSPVKRTLEVKLESALDTQDLDESLSKKQKLNKSFEEMEADFFQLLDEIKISPFSTWLIEREKIESDKRALALEPIDRKELFDKWSSITSEKYLEEKKKLDQNPAAVFIKLLDESVKTIRGARFDDFCRRFKNDSRFLKISSVKERQELYEKHLVKLKEEIRENARKEFGEMLSEWKKGEDLSALKVQTLTVEALLGVFGKDSRFLAVKNAIERENRLKLFLLSLKKEYTI